MFGIVDKIRQGADPRSKKITKNVFVSFGLKGMSMALSFLLVPMTLSYLTQYEYGVWLTLSSILVWLDFFDVGLGNGLRNKLTECLALGKLDLGRAYVSTTFVVLSMIGLTLIIVFYVLSLFVNWDTVLNTTQNPIKHISEVVLVVFILCVINFVMKTIGTIFIANQEPMMADMFGCISQLLSLLMIILLKQFTTGSLMNVAVCFSISPILVYFISYPYTFRKRFPRLMPSIKSVNLSLVKDIAGIGFQFFFIQVVCLLLFQSSNIIIAQVFSPAEVTPYNIGYRYLNVITVFFMIIITPLWSAITDAYTKQDYRWIQKSISVMIRIWLVFLLLVVILYFSSDFLITLWVGNEVIVSKSILLAISCFVSIDMWNRIFASFANGTSHLKIQLYSAILEGVIFIPLALSLSESMGVASVAWALMGVSLIPAVVLYLDYSLTLKKLIRRQ